MRDAYVAFFMLSTYSTSPCHQNEILASVQLKGTA